MTGDIAVHLYGTSVSYPGKEVIARFDKSSGKLSGSAV